MIGNDLIGRVEAQDKANEKAAIEAEKKLRKQINIPVILDLFKNAKNRQELQSKLTVLQNSLIKEVQLHGG